MEHTYYTCDRCGGKISDVIRHAEYMKYQTKKKTKVESTEYVAVVYTQPEVPKEFEVPEIQEIKVSAEYRSKRKSYELCKDCRKAFEKFMRNEG